MRIGFDAKRVFHNGSGLGEYGRNLLSGIAQQFPECEAHLYAYKPGNRYPENPFPVHYPTSFLGKALSSLWRTKGIVKDLKRDGIELYHGLSNEIPIGLREARIPSVVTIHDLIFLKYPQFYPAADIPIYKRKSAYAIQRATKIIAISEQTKQEIIEWQGIPAEKVEVVYQGCRDAFYHPASFEEIQAIRNQFGLNDPFVLAVGTGNPRKNLEVPINSLTHFVPSTRPLLVIAGGAGRYQRKLRQLVNGLELNDWVRFLEGVTDDEMPKLYQAASVFAFPSFTEGFGIPLIEAMAAGVPIIASDNPGFREVAGGAAQWFAAEDARGLASLLLNLLTHNQQRQELISQGRERAAFFRGQQSAVQTVEIYRKILG